MPSLLPAVLILCRICSQAARTQTEADTARSVSPAIILGE